MDGVALRKRTQAISDMGRKRSLVCWRSAGLPKGRRRPSTKRRTVDGSPGMTADGSPSTTSDQVAMVGEILFHEDTETVGDEAIYV